MSHELPPIVLIDDHGASGAQLSPMTDLRPAFDIRTGALTLLERVELAMGAKVQGAWVDPAIADLTRERFPALAINDASRFRGSVLAINARLGPMDHAAMMELVRAGGHGVIRDAHREVVAAIVPASKIGSGCLLDLAAAPEAARSDKRRVLTRTWHVKHLRDECLLQDLHLLGVHMAAARTQGAPPAWSTVIPHARHGLTIGVGAAISPGTVFDLEGGPILIAEGAVVRPGAIILGPAYVGPGSTVLEHAMIRPGTAIGPRCKVSGEIGGTIFQGFANKAHDGYLGDAYVGEWVNLGAGTTNSNLLNTYGEIIARPLGSRGEILSNERTGEQFLGCVLGDHVKTAICSRIMTGSIIGTGTMFAASGSLSGTVPGFSWMTDGGSKHFRFDKFLEVATAAMGRRKLTPSAAYVERLRELNAIADRRSA
jgi:UDP-N-acetylglucosamine diphosphorylase / glucose-1-phosphate thymidylyltransferase / UDP-N-acetylgalactosamine diphosphorylase / glucosamine-1-phosphate N-acetyltransferase / galactosamine-1-phosphate N-acetyltransferase